jgi:hypothetical protein
MDYRAADPQLLVAIRDDAEITMRVIHAALAAIGNFMAHSSAVIEDGSNAADRLEAWESNG